MSSPRADGETYKNAQCENQPCYVELTLAGNDIEDQLDKSNVTAAKAKTIKKCLNLVVGDSPVPRTNTRRILDMGL